jgi:hypothetical protein
MCGLPTAMLSCPPVTVTRPVCKRAFIGSKDVGIISSGTAAMSSRRLRGRGTSISARSSGQGESRVLRRCALTNASRSFSRSPLCFEFFAVYTENGYHRITTTIPAELQLVFGHTLLLSQGLHRTTFAVLEDVPLHPFGALREPKPS